MITGFEQGLAGVKVRASSGAITWRLREDGFRGVSVAADGVNSYVYATLTGWWAEAKDGSILCQTTANEYVDLGNSDEGWQTVGQETKSASQAQDYVNKMIANNKSILENNLLCARFSYKLSSSERQKLYSLQTRLQSRNDRLTEDGLVTVTKRSEAYGYSKLNSYLDSFMRGGGIGVVISTTTAIVIGAVVVAALSTAAYFAYKALYEESAQDVKFSNDLTKALISKLTPEEYQQLLDETAGMITKEKIKAKFGGAADLIKYALIGAGGYFIYKFIKGRSKE